MSLTMILVACLATGLSVAIYYVLQTRGQPVPEPVVHFRCNGCGQKLRIRSSKAGRPGMCPRCRQRWILPGESTIARNDVYLVLNRK